MNEWKKGSKVVSIYIRRWRENIYDDHIYVEKILEKATRLRRKNIVDAFDNSGGVD
jgi:hypothetical protein